MPATRKPLSPLAQEIVGIARAADAAMRASLDPRDPDPSRPGIFRDHNCWKCQSGAKPCVNGKPHGCEYLHARND